MSSYCWCLPWRQSMGRKGMEQKRELPPNCPYTSCLRWRGQSDARNTMASSTVPRICPTQRASSISTVTCPVKALVEATPISGPTWMYVPESVFLGIEAPTTLQMPYTKAPLLRANCMAATVPSGHTSFVTPYTSQRRSRMPQKEAG